LSLVSRACRHFGALNYTQRKRLGDVAVFENRQPGTEAKSINKSSFVILLPGVIRRLELISEQKVENISVAPLYCQTACCTFALRYGAITGILSRIICSVSRSLATTSKTMPAFVNFILFKICHF